ncbi:(2Fe-2S)-binding protein [Blastococcus sp. LR1]|uniref:(2Fe-2S)-binding protein n=1 Tax=Blastococcus sp. LR1 TaxID=2877000 RepID=UPI001CCB29B9|nr:(2Fe-2S)-binding protein [Blastococcus sp. LR1]MCA0144770.1 (2Fe-2S)-binding protein [Blastococcus sp. LR1]
MSGIQAQVAARVRGAVALGLVPPSGAEAVPATTLTDPAWLAELPALRSGDPRVAVTVWWYSASAVVMAPVLAGLAVGRPLSARLEDTTVFLGPGSRPVAAVSGAPDADPAGGLRECLEAVIPALAEVAGMRERPLWGIATDSLANGLLSLGRALGDVPAVTAVAVPLARAIGSPLPEPRYTDVAGVRFVSRVSCCLVDQLPHGSTCVSCPNRLPAERQALLESTARRFG